MRPAFAFAVIAASALVGCPGSTWSVVRKLDSGRHVGVASDRLARKMWVESVAGVSATARIGPRVVTVEPERVEVDGEPVAMIDGTAKSVVVSEVFDKLEILADGRVVYSGPF